MPDARTLFSDKDDVHLVKFLARHKPEPKGRLGNAIYQQLVENADDKWPWAKNHPWQSWRERYKKNQDAFDRKIRRVQKRQEEAEEEQGDVQEGPSTRTPKAEHRKNVKFTDSDDEHLAEFIASRGSDMGRLGTSLYKDLEAESDMLPWAKRHTSQSWRERYKKHQERIEGLIAKYASRKRVKKEKAATRPTELKEEARRVESSVQVPQALTSNPKGKERKKETPASVTPSKVGQTSKSKETQMAPRTSTIPPPASTPVPPNAPQASTSHSKGKENQHNDEAQQDRSTHVEMRQECTTGPAKNQRVKSATPAPVPKASKSQAPPPPSLNAKRKQKEVEPLVTRVQQNAISAPEREISNPAFAIKSQEEESDGDVDMHSLFGSDQEELDELEDSQSQNTNKGPLQTNPPAPPPPPPKKDLPPERILVPSSSQMAPPSSPAKPPPPPPPTQPLRKKAPIMRPRVSKKDENIFVSSDAEPSPSPPRPTKSSPSKPYAVAPKIVEGPYRSQLKRVRSRMESDSDEAPTKRARRNPESGSSHKKGEKMQVDLEERVSHAQEQSKENIDPEVAVAPTVKEGATQLHHARKSASQNAPVARTPAPIHAPVLVSPQSAASPHVVEPRPPAPLREDPGNAIASSSRVRLSDIPPPRKETPLAPVATPASISRTHLAAPKIPPGTGTPTVPMAATASTRKRLTSGSVADPLSSLKDSVARPRPSQPRNIEHTYPESSPRRDSGAIISPGGESEADFFNAPLHILSAGNNKGKEREYVLDVRPPRIDLLRESLNRRQSQIHSVSKVARTDSRGSSASNMTTLERRSRQGSAAVERRQPRTSVASEDAISAMLEWMAPLIDIAAEYNVPDSVAVRLFKRLMSMEKTEVVLFALSCDLTEEDGLKAYNKKKSVARAKEALALFAQSKKIFEEDVSSGSSEEEMPSGLVLRSQVLPASASAVKVERRESGASVQAQVPSTKRRRSRPSLIIRRIPSDQDAVMSDYVPPKNSRAGQYARLQKQGRGAEAKERELNRVLITETQTQFVPMRMHSPTVSPSPHTRLQVQDMSQVMLDDDAMRIDQNLHKERDHDEGQEEEEDEQEQDDDPNEDVFVDVEEQSQRDNVVMVENSEDEDLDAEDGSVVHAVDDDEEHGGENEGRSDVEQPSDSEEEEEEVRAEEEMVEKEQAGEEEDDDGEEEQEGEDEGGTDDGEVEEQHDEDNGIFGSRESEDEPDQQHYEERRTSPTNSDFDPDESHRASSPPPNENAAENHDSNNVAEGNDLAQSTGIVDKEDIHMPESLEMPYPGQLQRHEELQEVPEADPEAEVPAQSSESHMQPSSLPSLLTFGSGGPDKNPAFADVAKAHRQLTLNATAENYQELRDFEEKHNDKSDLMRLWSIKWAKALMQHNPTDNE